MPNKPHRAVRSCHSHPRKFDGRCIKGHCQSCGKEIPICQAYSYIDESNAAISNSAPYLCIECFDKQYGGHKKSEVEAFRDGLAYKFDRIAERGEESGAETAAMFHRMADYIRDQEV